MIEDRKKAVAIRVADIDNWPEFLEVWIFENWMALVQDYRRSFEEGELYEIAVYDSTGMKIAS